MEPENIFQTLNKVNVNDKIKTKLGLNYLSWADAWTVLKGIYPDAARTIYTRKVETTETTTTQDADGLTKTIVTKYEQEIPYFTDGKSCYVKVGVTIKGTELIELYPVMDLRNNAVRASVVTMTDVNKAIQRGFVRCCAMHGLALYIYAGEDLPDAERNAPVSLSNSNKFEDVKQDVVNLAQKMLNSKDATITSETSRYIQEMFPGVRLTQTTEEHLDKLLAARQYLYSLQK